MEKLDTGKLVGELSIRDVFEQRNKINEIVELIDKLGFDIGEYGDSPPEHLRLRIRNMMNEITELKAKLEIKDACIRRTTSIMNYNIEQYKELWAENERLKVDKTYIVGDTGMVNLHFNSFTTTRMSIPTLIKAHEELHSENERLKVLQSKMKTIFEEAVSSLLKLEDDESD